MKYHPASDSSLDAIRCGHDGSDLLGYAPSVFLLSFCECNALRRLPATPRFNRDLSSPLHYRLNGQRVLNHASWSKEKSCVR